MGELSTTGVMALMAYDPFGNHGAARARRQPLANPRPVGGRPAPARTWLASLAAAVPRRRALVWTAAAAGATAAGVLAPAAHAARPRAANHPIRLWFLADTDSLITNDVVLRLIQEATQPFVEAHPGVVVQAGFMEGNGIIPSMIAGQGPDVISDWYAAPYWEGNLLLPLDEYIKRDNIDTSVWSKGQMTVMQQPFGTYMLPAYFSPMVYIVRLDYFDELGLEYPSPDWTYKDQVEIARKLTVHTAKQTRYGTSVQFHTWGIGGETWIFKAFGGNVMTPDGTRQTLSQPACVEAGNWVFEELVWPGLASSRDQFYGSTGADGVVHGQEVMHVIWDGIILNFAAAARDSFKWAVYPSPIFPMGRMTQGTEDFYGINAQTKYPDMAWELLKWLSYEKTFQRSLMRIGAVPPARNDLWPEWQAVVEAVAPPTRGKGLEWFGDAALKGYAYPGEYFRYDDSQVRAVDAPWVRKLWAKQIDVAGAFAQMDRQANAVLSAAAETAATQAKLAGLLARATASQAEVSLPAPTTTGIGAPATPLPKGWATAKAGVYTLRGAGQGVQGGGDNASFWCAASTESRATFTCRLVSLANVDLPQIPNGAKVGLMARASLANDDAMVGVSVNMGRGIHAFGRSLPGSAYGDQSAGKTPGLLPAAEILRAGNTKQANYLIKPVWLRLVRDGQNWQAYSSLDGVHWEPAGTPIGAEMGGVWIGLFVTAHDGALGKSGLSLVATFDHVSGFTPTAAYQLGSP